MEFVTGMNVQKLFYGFYLKEMKRNFIAILGILIGIVCYSQDSDSIIIENRLKLKDYAFCQCLWHTMQENTHIKEDSLLLTKYFIQDGSASAYFLTSRYSLDTYEAIDSIAEIYSRKIYKSHEGETLGIMKCLDFYNSYELDRIIKSYDKYLLKSFNNEIIKPK